jgi:hypothetical protein
MKDEVGRYDGSDVVKMSIPLDVTRNLRRARNASVYAYSGGGFPRNSNWYFLVKEEPRVALEEVEEVVIQ